MPLKKTTKINKQYYSKEIREDFITSKNKETKSLSCINNEIEDDVYYEQVKSIKQRARKKNNFNINNNA